MQPEENAPGTADDIELATVAAVGTDGVTLLIDGNSEAGGKEYRVNVAQPLQAGDRVKISRISGSYVVEYVVGPPMARSIPSGGTDGQMLVKDGADPFTVKWADSASGLPPGGSTGQVLAKSSSSDYAVKWADLGHDLPTGGAAGQVLTKVNATNYNVQWSTIGTLPTGGTAGQVLTKANATNYSVQWETLSVGVLKNGTYTATMNNSGAIVPNTNGSVDLGTSSVPFGDLYVNGYVQIGTASYNSRLGFFGTPPITKINTITTSSTLANLIQALKNYGLL